jgi:hydroxymethylpyrimidine pyrophosphatase-like HAD family hydrolase
MTYKMICLDIDGTLLNSDLEISKHILYETNRTPGKSPGVECYLC